MREIQKEIQWENKLAPSLIQIHSEIWLDKVHFRSHLFHWKHFAPQKGKLGFWEILCESALRGWDIEKELVLQWKELKL